MPAHLVCDTTRQGRPLSARPLVLLAGVGAAAVAVISCPARAFVVQHASNTGAPAHWEAVVVPLAVSTDGLGAQGATAVRDVTATAARHWTALGCGVPWLAEPALAAGLAPAVDGHNAVIWATDWAGSPLELATTLVTRDVNTGEIVDADVLVNAARYRFAPPDVGPDAFDLEGVLTHELGHVLGLDHSDVPGATMAAYAGADPAPLATLETDDVFGACSLYEARPPSAGGSSGSSATGTAPRAPGGGAAALLGVLVAALATARRTSRRSPRVWLGSALAVAAAAGCAADAPAGGSGDTGETDTARHTLRDAGPSDAAPPDTAVPPPPQLAGTTWVVESWQTVDVGGGAVALEPQEWQQPAWRIRFGADGRAVLVRPGPSTDEPCAQRGRWSVEGNSVTWTWGQRPRYCPGDATQPVWRLTFSPRGAGRFAVEGAPVPGWVLGTTNRPPRAWRAMWRQVDDAPVEAPSCAQPAAACSIECPAEPGQPVVPRCIAPQDAPAADCRVEAGGAWVCRVGCHRTTCKATDGGTRVECRDEPSGSTCSANASGE